MRTLWLPYPTRNQLVDPRWPMVGKNEAYHGMNYPILSPMLQLFPCNFQAFSSHISQVTSLQDASPNQVFEGPKAATGEQCGLRSEWRLVGKWKWHDMAISRISKQITTDSLSIYMHAIACVKQRLQAGLLPKKQVVGRRSRADKSGQSLRRSANLQ